MKLNKDKFIEKLEHMIYSILNMEFDESFCNFVNTQFSGLSKLVKQFKQEENQELNVAVFKKIKFKLLKILYSVSKDIKHLEATREKYIRQGNVETVCYINTLIEECYIIYDSVINCYNLKVDLTKTKDEKGEDDDEIESDNK